MFSDSSFNIHNAFYFVKYPSRAAQNSPEGRRRPAGRGLKTPGLVHHEIHMDWPFTHIIFVQFNPLKKNRIFSSVRSGQNVRKEVKLKTSRLFQILLSCFGNQLFAWIFILKLIEN